MPAVARTPTLTHDEALGHLQTVNAVWKGTMSSAQTKPAVSRTSVVSALSAKRRSSSSNDELNSITSVFDKFNKESDRFERLVVLQDWEGMVEEMSASGFIARLRDLSTGADADAADVPFDDVAQDDRPLVKPGASFYLTVYRRLPNNELTTRIVFRRKPAWTSTILNSASDRARRLDRFFNAPEHQAPR